MSGSCIRSRRTTSVWKRVIILLVMLGTTGGVFGCGATSVTIGSPPDASKATFSSAVPGVKDISCTASATPSDRTQFISWTCENIETTAESWPTGSTGGGSGIHPNPLVTLRLTGLPSLNTSFGSKSVTATVDTVSDTNTYKLFFPRVASNNPYGFIPNWYYYWSQTSASSGTHQYSTQSGCYGYYSHGDDHFYVCDPAATQSNFTGHVFIDCFAEVCIHESTHMAIYEQWSALPDADGDDLPDIEEDRNADHYYDPATEPSDWQDADTDDDGEDDDENPCHAAELMWQPDLLSSVDWAYQGSQYYP